MGGDCDVHSSGSHSKKAPRPCPTHCLISSAPIDGERPGSSSRRGLRCRGDRGPVQEVTGALHCIAGVGSGAAVSRRLRQHSPKLPRSLQNAHLTAHFSLFAFVESWLSRTLLPISSSCHFPYSSKGRV